MAHDSVSVLMPGTCGELVQGEIDRASFLVSCPIDWYSAVTVAVDPASPFVVGPADAPKAVAAARAALRYFRRTELGARVSIASTLPRGKGMGSSTADVAGTIFAVAKALLEPISERAVAELALSIEPSDGSMFSNIALFDHRRGRRYENLGPAPRIDVAVLDFGGTVDTVAFNRRDHSSALAETADLVSEALALVRRGISERRVDLIGRGATISAVANQRVLFKPELPSVLDLARELGAAGVNVGHSGTVIGVLSDPERLRADEVVSVAKDAFPDLSVAYATRLVGGGCRTAKESLRMRQA